MSVESLAFGGQGVARYHDFVVFIDQGIPQQKVLARIFKIKKNHAEARLLRVLEQSPHFLEAPCPHFGACGGCRLQHLSYPQQLEAKQRQVVDTLSRLSGFSDFTLLPILPSPDLFYYRNKMEFSFSRHRFITSDEIASGQQVQKEGLFLGLHARGFFDKVVDIRNCMLFHPLANDILQEIRAIAENSRLPAYSTHDHTGFWRFVVFRHAKITDELMTNIVAIHYDKDIADELRERIMAKFPAITSLIYSTTTSKASVAFGEKEYLLSGKPTITEKIGPYSFEISANSFFQTNSKGTKRLYDSVIEMAGFRGDENVFDLYCGAGTISLYVSGLVRQVTGFEVIPSAVDDALRNALNNGISNCHFVRCDLMNGLQDSESIVARFGKPDLLIIDPPRGGMHPKTVKAILALAPQKIVHVSCNPTTLARDLAVLCENDYVLTKVQPVDMFPHTAHIEVVVQMVRK